MSNEIRFPYQISQFLGIKLSARSHILNVVELHQCAPIGAKIPDGMSWNLAGREKTSSPKGNDRSPESNVPRSNLI